MKFTKYLILTAKLTSRKIAREKLLAERRVGVVMDWKEQLSTLLEGEMQTIDVRLICIRDKEKWFLKRLRATVFHSEPSLPEQICYLSYLFLRGKMSSLDFLQLMSDLTTRSTLSQEELEKLSDEEKLKKFRFKEREIFCEYANVYLRGHSQGNSSWGLGEFALPTWNFEGTLSPDIRENQEPLIAQGSHYFPKPIDGAAWYLYEKALPISYNTLPVIEISLEDDRAFFSGIDLEEETSLVRCHCGGRLLTQSLVQLYTSYPQVESKQAEGEVVFQLEGQPAVISLVLTYADTWLDRRDMNLANPRYGVPKDVIIIARSDYSTYQEEIAHRITNEGENMTLEFKSRLDEGEGIDRNRFLQTVVAFANTSGGTILLGVANDGQVLGLDPNDTKDTVVRKIDGNVSPVPYFEVIPQEQEGKPILVVFVRASTIKPCALMVNKNKPQFYVRMDGSNKLAKPEDIWQMFNRHVQGNVNDPMSLIFQQH